jgi:hypothetical protein
LLNGVAGVRFFSAARLLFCQVNKNRSLLTRRYRR